ncbi:potassium channel family protein [Acidaminobacter sp. JC074]|uniref:potassium channel family protein n=1 Tax=Acidaminobacter sp. JC074 TaxID=2530199 RepID=UPI001F101740|nr:potassium channel family protein [Acidaminobacter sp. JC074]
MKTARKKLETVIDVFAILIVIEYFLFFVGLSRFDPDTSSTVDLVFILVLAIDFLLRYKEADNKRTFLKENWLEILAFIPFIKAFRIFRVFRIIRKSRVRDFFQTVHQMLRHNSLYYVILVVLLLSIIGGGFLFRLENDITTLQDGIWFSFVTMTTVGYGDYTPSTMQGRIIAIFMMIIGIGFLGVLTGSIASFFTTRARKKFSKQDTIDISDLSKEEKSQVMSYLDFIRSKKSKLPAQRVVCSAL